MYHHVTVAADERFVLFPGPSELRRAVRAVVRVAGERALLFHVVDDHLHLVLAGTRPEAGRLAQALGVALGRIAASELQPARIRPVDHRAHLASLVPYVLGQADHHGLGGHPAEQVGSCFADLVGARRVGFGPGPLFAALPRLPRSELHRAVRLPTALEPASLDGVALPTLVTQFAEALALDDLRGRHPVTLRARGEVARVAADLGFAQARVAVALGVSEHALRRSRSATAWPELTAAVRRRFAIAAAVGSGSAGVTAHSRGNERQTVHESRSDRSLPGKRTPDRSRVPE